MATDRLLNLADGDGHFCSGTPYTIDAELERSEQFDPKWKKLMTCVNRTSAHHGQQKRHKLHTFHVWVCVCVCVCVCVTRMLFRCPVSHRERLLV